MNQSPYLPPAAPPPPPPPGSLLSAEERNWAMAGHLSAFAGLVIPGFGSFLGPLVVWQAKKESMPFAAAEAKEAFNFHLTWFLALSALLILAVILLFVFVGFLLFPLIAIIPLASHVLSLIAGLKAQEGRAFRYPLTIRFAN